MQTWAYLIAAGAKPGAVNGQPSTVLAQLWRWTELPKEQRFIQLGTRCLEEEVDSDQNTWLLPHKEPCTRPASTGVGRDPHMRMTRMDTGGQEPHIELSFGPTKEHGAGTGEN